MKKIRIITMILVIAIVLLNIINPIVNATIDPDDYKPDPIQKEDADKITNMVNPIIGVIKTIGIVVAVVTMGALGFKYMTGSISEKADYKKTMIPYLIGATLVVAITQLIGVIIQMVEGIKV